MNIFILDKDPETCAKMHCDKHIVKMVLETAQILSTVVQPDDVRYEGLYKPTHRNHPCTKWAGESLGNFVWLYCLGLELAREYRHRYGKVHKSGLVIVPTSAIAFRHVGTDMEMTPFAQAMPEQYRNEDAVSAYRNYYLSEKASIAKWTKREIPSWWK